MSSIITRAGKGSALTHNQLDTNFKQAAQAKTANYTVAESDNRDTIECSGTFTVTLPDVATVVAAADTGDFEVTIKNTGTGVITIARTTALDTIDGTTDNIVLSASESVTLKVNQAGNGFNRTSVSLAFEIADNITALKAITPIADRIIYLRGHTTVNDGGGGEFIGITGAAAGTYTDDNGITILPTGGDGSAAWVRVYSGPVHAVWFGLDESKTAAVNTTAFLSALAVINTNGGDLHLHDGDFSLSIGQLKLGTDSPTDNIFRKIKGTGATKLIFPNTAGIGIRIIGSYCEISGIFMECDKATLSDYSVNTIGIQAWRETSSDPAGVANFLQNIKIDDCEIDNFYTAIDLEHFFYIHIERVTARHYFYGVKVNEVHSGYSSEAQSFTLYIEQCYFKGTRFMYASPTGSTGIWAKEMTDISVKKTMVEFTDVCYHFDSCDGVTGISNYSEAWYSKLCNLETCGNVQIYGERAANTLNTSDIITIVSTHLIIHGGNYGRGTATPPIVKKGSGSSVRFVEAPPTLSDGMTFNLAAYNENYSYEGNNILHIKKDNMLLQGNDPSTGVGNYGYKLEVDTANTRGILTLRGGGTAAKGLAEFQNDNNTVGSITVTGTSTAYNTSSDERLKKNIRPIEDANFDKLNPVSFEWKSDGASAEGFIAQELYQIYPDAVAKPTNATDTWKVDMSKLIPYIVNEILKLKKAGQ